MSLIHDPLDDDLDENPNIISECCGAPIMGQVVDDLAICSQCREWCGVRRIGEDEEEE